MMTERMGVQDRTDETARRLFDRSLAKAQFKRLAARVTGTPRHLRSLAEDARQSGHRRTLGSQIVPLEAIQGSVDKAQDFDADFHPLHEATKERWVSVATALRRGITLPQVELIRVGERYYVVDGHHRVSASRALGFGHIDALVIEWTLA
ncbi:MAG: ParB N-terminal domain-containing protein [Anaerolineae bacterium]|nr:ParB N-terminal domain-containing protein [Anaerolineae bacterium]